MALCSSILTSFKNKLRWLQIISNLEESKETLLSKQSQILSQILRWNCAQPSCLFPFGFIKTDGFREIEAVAAGIFICNARWLDGQGVKPMQMLWAEKKCLRSFEIFYKAEFLTSVYQPSPPSRRQSRCNESSFLDNAVHGLAQCEHLRVGWNTELPETG
jgi:hypothetical protein